MQLGIEVLLQDQNKLQYLKSKKVALLAHPASVSQKLEHSVDLLYSKIGSALNCCFGPQHGMKGEKQDNMIESDDYVDPQYNIPIFSLYGEVRRPTKTMLEHFDILLIDLQDLGTRIYTFLTTLAYLLEDCAQARKEVWVLDRPNPAGRKIEGMSLQTGWESFVGVAPIPMRHGLSLAEFANWYIQYKNLNLEHQNILMKEYQPEKAPGFGWPEELIWVNPSPNAPSVNMARAYPGTVIIEGTNLSEGRGTTTSLELVGAPDIEQKKIMQFMNAEAPELYHSCYLRHCYFQPTFHKHQQQLCQGMQFHTTYPLFDPAKFSPYLLIALWLKGIRKFHPEYSIWRDFHYEYEQDRLAIDLINGSPRLRKWVDGSEDFSSFYQEVEQDGLHWQEEIRKFLLY